MYSIYHDFTILASPSSIFEAVTTPAGLNSCWTTQSKGNPEVDHLYQFYFGPEYDWQAKVNKVTIDQSIEWVMIKADQDWKETILGFSFSPSESQTLVSFYHTGWKHNNAHFRRSSFCWAEYLLKLKSNLETPQVLSG